MLVLSYVIMHCNSYINTNSLLEIHADIFDKKIMSGTCFKLIAKKVVGERWNEIDQADHC